MKVSFPSVGRDAVYEVLAQKMKCLSVLDVLSGSKQIRYGRQMSAEHVVIADNLVRRYERLKEPIQLVTCWGALKAYGLFNVHGVCFADFVGLNRFKQLNDGVKIFYPQGIKVSILLEDVTTEILGSDVSKIGVYEVGLRSLISSLGLEGIVDIIAESDFIETHHDLGLYIGIVKGYAKVFYGGEYPDGWTGTISPTKWDYYLNRALSKEPELSYDQARYKVSLYFANSLARYQVGAFYSQVRDEQGMLPAFKASYSIYPEGTEPSLYKNRFEYKVKASKSSKKTIPPWAGYAVFSGQDWSMVGIKDMRLLQYSVETLTIGDTDVSIIVS